MAQTLAPTTAFTFRVTLAGDVQPVLAQGVEGLDSTMDTEPLVEGGENRFVHSLPKSPRHANLKLKHMVAPANGPLVQWVHQTLQGSLTAPIEPKTVHITLLNTTNQALASWTVRTAYPVGWKADSLDSMKNELAVDTLELAYQEITRDPTAR
ncbi:phage tail protein [uncultured Tateyamaria sp.]|uniref:phage tail protein n=1 Tax=Tateyamaria sp. 1078 TaxID=3417464 RepID=UPI00260DDF00|nr:phage tail protein [uncultured Tateyamaria sp.]